MLDDLNFYLFIAIGPSDNKIKVVANFWHQIT